MRRQYLSAPLPFQGQKRMFAKEFIKVLKHYPDDAVFVDLFGGCRLVVAYNQVPKSLMPPLYIMTLTTIDIG